MEPTTANWQGSARQVLTHSPSASSSDELLPGEKSLLLSEQTASSGHRRLALAVAAALTIALLSILFIGDRPLARTPAYVPIVDSVMFVSDLLTAVLIYSQYSVGRQRSSLALAMGYLFAALIIVPHVLTFPGNFSPTGLFGANVDTAFWLYYCCRFGFFTAVIAYSVLKESQGSAVTSLTSVRASIVSSVITVAVLVLLLTTLAIHAESLPDVMLDSVHSGSLWNRVFAPVLLVMSVTAIALLWRHRSSVLAMWLLVAQWAWLIETLLLSLNRNRFSMFWYGGIFGQIASCVVLLVLLYQTATLYARTALSAEARSREGERQRLALQVVTGSVAHELQQPLGAIIRNSEAAQMLLAQSPPNLADACDAIDDVACGAHRASDLISSINATLKGMAVPLAPVVIGQIVREALQHLHGELRGHNVTVQLEIPSDLPMVLGNRSQLVQVLVNLITNAIEAMADVTDRPHVLRIRAAPGLPSKVAVTVADSGRGIDCEDPAHIFNPFFTTKSRGTGLGLAICRQIIEAHAGHISAAPATDFGLAFAILLPTA
jgi:signal transduction histidine kinase